MNSAATHPSALESEVVAAITAGLEPHLPGFQRHDQAAAILRKCLDREHAPGPSGEARHPERWEWSVHSPFADEANFRLWLGFRGQIHDIHETDFYARFDLERRSGALPASDFGADRYAVAAICPRRHGMGGRYAAAIAYFRSDSPPGGYEGIDTASLPWADDPEHDSHVIEARERRERELAGDLDPDPHLTGDVYPGLAAIWAGRAAAGIPLTAHQAAVVDAGGWPYPLQARQGDPELPALIRSRRDDPSVRRSAAVGRRWDRALLALGEEPADPEAAADPRGPVTEDEARRYERIMWPLWGRVADAIAAARRAGGQ